MKERSWPAWLALTGGVAIATLAVIVQNPPSAEPADSYPTVFSAARAMKQVEAIAREPHPTGSVAIGKVRDTIVDSLQKIGLEPEIQIPKDPARAERNVLVRLPGKGARGSKALLLCAHHDSVKSGPGAGDNASGVATILETLRALKASPRLERDVIALLDDGEESGLTGAQLFVDEHRWARDVGVVLNVDARGNHGPSFMFETSAKNGWLVRQYAEATPHPFATSMSMDIYRIMPNDTDLSVFNRAGMDGLNFAFCRGISVYHSASDIPANLDPRTLQHHGENLLAMTRKLGDLDLEQVREEDVIYFSYLNRGVIFYPARWAVPFALGSAGIFLLTFGVGLIMGRARFIDVLAGFVTWFVAAFVSIFVVGAYWLVLRDMMASVRVAPAPFDLPILVVGAILASVVTLTLERLAARNRSIESLSLGALAWWVILALLTAIYLPGMSYLFTWPLVFGSLGLASLMIMRRGSGLAREAILVGCLPALLLFPPLTRESFEGMSLPFVGPLMILVVLFLGGILPLLAPVVVSPKPAEGSGAVAVR